MDGSDRIYRLMQPGDKPVLLDLWQEVFGDGADYAAPCLDIFAGEGNVLVADVHGRPVAMLLAVPCQWEGQQGVYLYALATNPQYRGLGVMSTLMAMSDDLAAAKGSVFSVLIPASETLYGYYRHHGYDKTLFLRHLSFEGLPTEGASGMVEQVPHDAALKKARRLWLDAPAVDFAGERGGLVAQELAKAGAVLLESSKGYLVCLARDEVLYVAELGAASDEAALELMGFAAGKYGCRTCRLSLPDASKLFLGQGGKRPAAVLKGLDPSFVFQPETYLRFAKDEAFNFDLPHS